MRPAPGIAGVVRIALNGEATCAGADRRNRHKLLLRLQRRLGQAALLYVAGIGIGLAAGIARADVRPHALCGECPVLQRQTDAKIWGAADPGEEVTVAFRGRKASATTDPKGRWTVTVASGEAGGPFELGITGRNTLTYKNVLVGEGWLCSGQ